MKVPHLTRGRQNAGRRPGRRLERLASTMGQLPPLHAHVVLGLQAAGQGPIGVSAAGPGYALRCYAVLLTEGAEHDLEAIHRFIVAHDSFASADRVLDRLLEVAEELATYPERGGPLPELLALGIRDYRQVLFSPYRVIYRIVASRVYVHLVVDGRRELQSLLSRRRLSSS